jgi:TonB family protein
MEIMNRKKNILFSLNNNCYFVPFLISLLLLVVVLFGSLYVDGPVAAPVDFQAVKSDLIIIECDLSDAREKRKVTIREQYPAEKKELESVENVNSRFAKKSQALKDISEVNTSYKHKILLKIIKHKYYPFQAQRMQLEDEVLLKFTIDNKGNLLGDVSVSKASRYHILTAAGIKTIKLAAPFPPFPNKFKSRTRTFTVPVNYTLGG